MEKCDAINHLEEILKDEPPLHRHERDVYISAVRGHFAEIQTLQKQGYSFIQICRALMKDGELPVDARARYFRQAFHRERLRREKDAILAASLAGNSRQIAGKILEKPVREEVVIETTTPTAEALEKERRQKLGLDTMTNTRNGRVVRNMNGGFEF